MLGAGSRDCRRNRCRPPATTLRVAPRSRQRWPPELPDDEPPAPDGALPVAGELAPPAGGLAELPVEGGVVELEWLEGEVVEPEPLGEVVDEPDERGVEAP